jgi:hypothetical protein
MKIKHYIVTYNNNEVLNTSLESIFSSLCNYSKDNYKVYIINNHSNFWIDSKFEPYVEVLHNVLRPDFSTGHLSRNWNQAIINGFVDLLNPDCDIVITSQNDCVFKDDFIKNLIELHKNYDLIQFGAGDNFISYTPNSIIEVGMWDERFCNIGYQEADYFLRSVLSNSDRTSINDIPHQRTHNTIDNNIIKESKTGYVREEPSHMSSLLYHTISENVYIEKWGDAPLYHIKNGWCYDNLKHLTPKIKSYMLYPYFEKNIKNKL